MQTFVQHTKHFDGLSLSLLFETIFRTDPSLQDLFSSKKPFLFPATSQKYVQYLSISFPIVYFVILNLTFIRILNSNKIVFHFWLLEETVHPHHGEL
jgi:hypothetical protein